MSFTFTRAIYHNHLDIRCPTKRFMKILRMAKSCGRAVSALSLFGIGPRPKGSQNKLFNTPLTRYNTGYGNQQQHEIL